ncbi:MAG: hypothetical protein WDM81_08860 [Rhizomicrobium sp.]
MDTETLLQEVTDYCRRTGMAESTFGRHSVNDGKFVSRLKLGGRVTLETMDRVHAFMRQPAPPRLRASSANGTAYPAAPPADPERNFRFYDNRQKYLMFVNTCSEKREIASRVSLELANIHPRPPAVRMFDAGVGDGTVLARVLRSMHRRFEHMPFYVVGKEISLEDVRLALEKMPDRFHEHPATVLILTNLYYSEAPYLLPSSVTAATSLVWHELPLRGSTAAEFEEQISDLEPFLAQNWRAAVSKKSGNPVYEKPVVLVIYLEDCRFLLDQVIPRRGSIHADYDLVIASQPYRARALRRIQGQKGDRTARAKPGARREADRHPFGRRRSGHGDHPEGLAGRAALHHDAARHPARDQGRHGARARHFNFNALPDDRSHFQYEMYTLPNEIDAQATSIGTSTLFAAWNDAAYVAQIEDDRLTQAMRDSRYLDATRDVLKTHNGLWFRDESYVISRKREM